MEPTLSILIVSYNTREITLACIESVYRETLDTTFELIVVDNASADGSADAIAAAFPQVRLVRSAENLGFARANNLAAEAAAGRYLLLLNPDVVVLDRALDRLLAFAEARPGARIWGGRTLNADRSLNPASCWRRMSLWSVFCSTVGLSLFSSSPIFAAESYGGWQRDSVREVDIVTGCFLLIQREFWRQLQGFDPAYFMYGEEADLCLRARRLGARPMITPEAAIIHYNSPKDAMRPDKHVGILRAKMTLIRKHWPPVIRSIGAALFLLGPLARKIGYSAAALMFGPGAESKAKTWSEVWNRRGQWFPGYPGVRSS
jgi:GT2 family glycosyltransferase